ncbi:unnamed protein product [Allacma fusca]|uniref:Uncharacterized protein n=1 Tax=Allacma fusca TaxID=39272 RepID=A0A8J2JI77_9HEXA|nr:unnamed protein product [Allacma fusca]
MANSLQTQCEDDEVEEDVLSLASQSLFIAPCTFYTLKYETVHVHEEDASQTCFFCAIIKAPVLKSGYPPLQPKIRNFSDLSHS